jgi:hypothetical protein
MERPVLYRATRARYSTMTNSTKDATVFASICFAIMPEVRQDCNQSFQVRKEETATRVFL